MEIGPSTTNFDLPPGLLATLSIVEIDVKIGCVPRMSPSIEREEQERENVKDPAKKCGTHGPSWGHEKIRLGYLIESPLGWGH